MSNLLLKRPHGLAFKEFGHPRARALPLVFIHGVGLNKDCWFLQTAPLKQSHHLFTIDLPGHGDSPSAETSPQDLTYFADAVARFCAQTIKGPAIIVGHSLGALIALEMAGRHSQFCGGLVPLSTIYRRNQEAASAVAARAIRLKEAKDQSDFTEIVMAPVTRWFGNMPTGVEKEMADLCHRWLASANPSGYAMAYSLFAAEDGPDDTILINLHMPSLFITGTDDPNSTPEMSQAMAALNADSEAKSIPGARHMLQLTHGEVLSKMISQFAQLCNKRAEK